MIDNLLNAADSCSIYIHIPFCIKKCNYCDFLSFPCSEIQREEYINALINEIEESYFTGRKVNTIFFGGGTPSLLSPARLSGIMKAVEKNFTLNNPEITMEVNPATVDYEKLREFREAGINRLSIGLQSSEKRELEILGRIHDYQDFLKTYEEAVRAGFENINIDVMSALPKQSIESFRNTLKKIIELKPAHISAYSLIIEENTAFYDNKDILRELPSEDVEREMYYMTKSLLEQNGYIRYEISNYAKPGYECRHNKVYWSEMPYLGFGIGAASYMDGIRFSNTENIGQYITFLNRSVDTMGIVEEEEQEKGEWKPELYRKEYELQTIKDKKENFMIFGLRMTEGVSIDRWNVMFGTNIENDYGEVIKNLIEQGLMKMEKNYLKLTDRGIDVSNRIFEEFLIS